MLSRTVAAAASLFFLFEIAYGVGIITSIRQNSYVYSWRPTSYLTRGDGDKDDGFDGELDAYLNNYNNVEQEFRTKLFVINTMVPQLQNRMSAAALRKTFRERLGDTSEIYCKNSGSMFAEVRLCFTVNLYNQLCYVKCAEKSTCLDTLIVPNNLTKLITCAVGGLECSVDKQIYRWMEGAHFDGIKQWPAHYIDLVYNKLAKMRDSALGAKEMQAALEKYKDESERSINDIKKTIREDVGRRINDREKMLERNIKTIRESMFNNSVKQERIRRELKDLVSKYNTTFVLPNGTLYTAQNISSSIEEEFNNLKSELGAIRKAHEDLENKVSKIDHVDKTTLDRRIQDVLEVVDSLDTQLASHISNVNAELKGVKQASSTFGKQLRDLGARISKYIKESNSRIDRGLKEIDDKTLREISNLTAIVESISNRTERELAKFKLDFNSTTNVLLVQLDTVNSTLWLNMQDIFQNRVNLSTITKSLALEHRARIGAPFWIAACTTLVLLILIAWLWGCSRHVRYSSC